MSCTYQSFIYLHHFIYLLYKNLNKGQLTCNDILDYMNSSKVLRFQTVPYSKFHQMRFSRKNIYDIRFKILHVDKEFKTGNGCLSLLNQKKQSLPLYRLKWMNDTVKNPKRFLSRNQKNPKKLNKKNKIDLISLEKICFS